MTRAQQQLIALLRAGLTGAALDTSLFEGSVRWDEIYDLGDRQTLNPILTDGIEYLPDALKPDIDAVEPFLADTMATEMRNDALNRFARGLFHKVNSSGVPVLMVKGQPLAELYPHPRHRQPGDIDILVRPEDYHTVKDLIISRATRVEPEHLEILHQGMTFGSIEVEVHGTISTLMSVKLDRQLAAMMADMFKAEDFVTVDFGGEPVKTPGVLFNAVYILVHFLHHYWSGGVGLRQLADWGLFVTRHFEALDPARLETVLRELGILRLWQTFAGVAVAHLGLDKARFPLWTDHYSAKYEGILRYIFKCGNFGGHQRDKEKKERSYAGRKLHSFWKLVICDRLRHFPEFPAESLRIFFGATHYGLIRLSEGE